VERGLSDYADEYDDDTEEIEAGGLSGYYLLPANYAARGVPITMIHLRSKYWLTGFQNQVITAKWGYSVAAPDGIVYAATVLAAGIYNFHRGGGEKGVKSESIGNYSVSYGDDAGWDALVRAKEILNSYRKWAI
jgi:hypothetical protein